MSDDDYYMTEPNLEVAELAAEDDRCWFESHPEERVRHRAAFHGEFPPESFPKTSCAAAQVEVTQLRPGLRLRRLWFAVALREVKR